MTLFDEIADLLVLIYSPDDALKLISEICKDGKSKIQREKEMIQAVRTAIRYLQFDNEALERELKKYKGR